MTRSRRINIALGCCLVLVAGCASSPGSMVRPGGVAHPVVHVGLLERIAAGNIDGPGSEAYLRWGPGYDLGIRASDRKFEARP